MELENSLLRFRKDYFPYFTQGKSITITGIELYDGKDVSKHHAIGNQDAWNTATTELNDNKNKQAFTVPIAPDDPVLTPKADAQAFLIVRYNFAT